MLEYLPGIDQNGPPDPADISYEFAMKLEREEQEFESELRDAVSDALELLEARIDKLDRYYEGQQMSNDKLLTVKAAMGVLEDI